MYQYIQNYMKQACLMILDIKRGVVYEDLTTTYKLIEKCEKNNNR